VSPRRRLPPGARWITLSSGARRVEVVVDLGPDPATGRRRQSRRRFTSIDDANAWHAETSTTVRRGEYVHRARETVAEAVELWLGTRRNVRPTTLAGYRDALAPVCLHLGAVTVQALSRREVETLVDDLLTGGLVRADGRARRPWSPRTVTLMLFCLESVLDSFVREGRLARNVVEYVERPAQRAREMQTWTAAEVETFLGSLERDRDAAAWLLALHGLRRGEVAGLRWSDIDFDALALTVSSARVEVQGHPVESAPKTDRGRRTLPLTTDLVTALKTLRTQQAADRLLVGEAWQESGFVIVDPLGRPLSPSVLSSRWQRAVRRAGVPRIRLHDARHTAATLMHLRGVPVAVISAWLGHSTAAFTMRTYVHSQADELRGAADVLGSALRGSVTSA
jgi:integrase